MKYKAMNFILKYARFLILIILLISLTFLSPAFMTFKNITNVLGQASLLIIVSYGMTLAIIVKGIDLSMGSVLALSSCVAASFIKSGNLIVGIAAGLLIGLICGSINGIVITKIGLTPFIATYGMDWISRGLAYVFMGGTQIYGFNRTFRFIGSGEIMGIPLLIIEVLLVTLILSFVTYKTVYGRNIYAIGCNIKATKLSGINTDRIVISVFAINGLLAAFAGILYISRLNAAEALIGTDFTLNSIAATLIGGTPFSGGEGGIGRTIIGAAIMTFLINGMNLLEISPYWQTATVGFVILLSLFIENISKHFQYKSI